MSRVRKVPNKAIHERKDKKHIMSIKKINIH
jgi:hypothetical protein